MTENFPTFFNEVNRILESECSNLSLDPSLVKMCIERVGFLDNFSSALEKALYFPLVTEINLLKAVALLQKRDIEKARIELRKFKKKSHNNPEYIFRVMTWLQEEYGKTAADAVSSMLI